MDRALADQFPRLWAEHFPGAELPVTFFFADAPEVPIAPAVDGWRCLLASLAPVRAGKPLAFGVESIGCEGGKRYVGFVQERPRDMDWFLSCGVPGGRDGLRLKDTPQRVAASDRAAPRVVASRRYLVAKRWDSLVAADEPEVVTFFVRPDALAGLVALASFDRPDDEGTAIPAVAGCASAFGWAFTERDADRPRCFAGLLDFTPRQYVRPDELTFAAPFRRFTEMVENLPRSFAVTPAWRRVITRPGGHGASTTDRSPPSRR